MVRLADIARELGLNVSVVSRALSTNPDRYAVVKQETKEKIRACAKAMGYRPNRQASFLGKGKCATIFCFLPDVPTRLINDLLFGISETACAKNFPINFFFGKNASDLENFVAHSSKNDHAGLITYAPNKMSPQHFRSFAEYYRRGGKILLLNTISNTMDLQEKEEFSEVPRLNIDETYGGRLAASHFLQKKCERIFLLSAHLDYFEAREKGFIDECGKAGREIEIISVDEISRISRVDGRCAVFADDDYMALNLYSFAATNGKKIGKDLLICGFDDIFYGRIATPSLTTVHQPTRAEGGKAVEKLINMIYGAKEKDELLRPYLACRESTGEKRPDPELPESEDRIYDLKFETAKKF